MSKNEITNSNHAGYKKYKFKDICLKKGFIRGPFGSALKKSLFVPKGEDTYKVYEQCVPLEQNKYSGHYYITGEYFRNALSRFEVQHNDFLVSCSGVNYGAIYHLQEPFEKGVINQALLIIRIDNTIVDHSYFKYLFRIILSKAITSGTGDSTIPNFPSLDVIKDIDVYLPSLDIQRKIGKTLNDIDNKINTNKRIGLELESMAKTLYDYWFTQFDFPNAEGKPYRTSGGEMVWNEQLKRDIPKGWNCSVIANHIGNSKSGDWGKEAATGNYLKEVICIRGADFPSINGDKIPAAPTRYILEKNANKVLSSGDIIVEISGGSPTQSTGRVCYINENTIRRFDKDIITSNFCRAFSTKKKSEQYWLYLLWKSLYDAGVLFGFEGKTTGIKNLLFDIFCAQYKIISPDETILENFHEIVSPIFDKIQQYNIENDELGKLRDWLLPMLMNGQATVE